ncbi:hypothetical protein [Streptomyces kebangsaanensis]|uniref:hypothetical protein n=1 Tax=Streptomyces kebangsaanensis TaxID=864058 RepID=UPI00093E73CE|nr:hypothetical protein [Streptomyces kebangsaanensis]
MTTPSFAAQAEPASPAPRQKYNREPETQLSGTVNPNDLRGFLKRTRWTFLATLLLVLPVALVLLFVDLSLAIAALVIVPLFAALGTLFIPHRLVLSEFQVLLDGKAAAAESAYGVIYQVIKTRRMPVSVATRRFRTPHDPTINNFLVVTDRETQVYVSVFPYGTGLYLGWSMWSTRRPVAMFGRFVKDAIAHPLKGQKEFTGQLSSQRVRALREAVHSAVSEGVDAAVHNVQVPLAQTFGHNIPVETVALPAATTPAPWPGAGQASVPVPAVPPAPASPPVQ